MSTLDRASSESALTVLVVDDDPDHRLLIRRRLAGLGCDTREARSGEDALTQLDGVDLVLCDYRLPGMDGVTTLRRIAERDGPAGVLVTGMGSEAVAVEALRAGAVDYLIKDARYLDALPGVVERAARAADLERRAAEVQRLALLVHAASGHEAVFAEVVRGARRLLRAASAALYLRGSGGLSLEAVDEEVPSGGGAPLEVVARVLATAPHSRDVAPHVDPAHDLVVVPLPGDGDHVGALVLIGLAGGRPSAEELDLARTFASFAGLALVHLRRLQLQQRVVNELEELAALRRQLLTSVSHELRTPLTCVVGFSRTLEERWDDLPEQKRREIIPLIRQHGQDLTGLVEQLLDSAAIEAGIVATSIGPVDVHDLVTGFAAAHAPVLAGRQLVVDASPAVAHADEALLRRVVANLVSNAVKYSPSSTPIRLRCAQAAGHVRIEVSDEGIGLDDDEVSRMFEPFWRAPAAREMATPGTGVGLALVAEHVRLMSGQVHVRSAPGHGTTVTVVLPAAEVPAPAVAT